MPSAALRVIDPDDVTPDPEAETPPPERHHVLNPILVGFGAFFGLLTAASLLTARADVVTIFLGSATLLCLGVNVGKITGKP